MVNLFIFEAHEVVDGHVTITDAVKVEHMHRVLKATVGSTIKMGQLGGSLYTGHVVEMTPQAVRVRIEVVPDSDYNDASMTAGVCLLLGTPRPKMVQSICVVAATMGVDHIVMVRSERVDKSYFGSRQMRAEEMKKNLIHGAEQGVVRRLPLVTPYQEPAIEGMLRDVWPGWEERLKAENSHCVLVKLIAEPRYPHNLVEATALALQGQPDAKPLFVLAVGPEGGWVAPEVELFKAAGFLPFHMGDRILRTETAVVALLSQICLLRSSLPWMVDAAASAVTAKRVKVAGDE